MNNNSSSGEIISDFYTKFYKKIFHSKTRFSVTEIAYRFTHRAIENKVSHLNLRSKILEIGAGNGEHLSFVKNNYKEYIMVDKSKQQVFKLPSNKVKFIQSDISNCNFPANSFDRIIITCVLHHLDNPFQVMSLLDKWLKKGGTISIFLPCDPGVAVRLSRFLFVNPRAKKVGFNKYNFINALEHKNHVWGLQVILNEIFYDYRARRKYYPFLIPNNNINLFSIQHLTKQSN